MSRIRADRYTNREGTGAPTFSAGVNVVGVTSMSGDLAVTNGTITGSSQLTISGITSSISDTAVDIFVYDTSKDSDGGAWRKRTQNTSWYNETLGTATRGSRKEFPAVAVIVMQEGTLTIYDGDDPDLPMWMVFTDNNDTGSQFASAKMLSCRTATSIFMLNGMLMCGGKGAYHDGATELNFLSDSAKKHMNNGYYYNTLNISQRETTGGYYTVTSGTPSIVNNLINDVVMTVLPNAPIDSATGLPIPTIAVGTDNGLSVIRDNGNVYDIIYGTRDAISVSFNKSNNLNFLFEDNDVMFVNVPVPSTDYSNGTAAVLSGQIGGSAYHISSLLSGNLQSAILGGDVLDILPNAISGTSGLTFISNETPTGFLQGAVAYTTTSYNTGWMHGDIKGAFLSDTDTTNKTNGQTDPDRSVNNNALNVTGTITKSAVATGADLVAYSGWSTSNYLEQPYNSDLNFGTGDYYVMGWAKPTSNTAGYVWEIGQHQNTNGYTEMFYHNSGEFRFYLNGVGNVQGAAPLNIWTHFVCLRQSGVMYMFINGVRQSITVNNTASLNNTSAKLRIGIRAYDIVAPFFGEISLVRTGAGAPSAEQIKKIYEDEKFLFQENAKATLYGSSDAVTALAYDEVTDQLHVGTSAGRSEFQGLRRINNTTTAVTTALSASNELVAEQ